MAETTRQWIVTEERRTYIEHDECGAEDCGHDRIDHIDDMVNGEPVGCVNPGCWYEETRHKFVEVPKVTDRWVVVNRRRHFP